MKKKRKTEPKRVERTKKLSIADIKRVRGALTYWPVDDESGGHGVAVKM